MFDVAPNGISIALRAAGLAEAEDVTDAYVCRLLPLTCLAPDIVEAILDGRQPKALRLAEVLGNGTLNWSEKRMNCRLKPTC